MNGLLASATIFLLQDTAAGRISEGIQHPDLSKFLIIGALLFAIGVAGGLTRRHIIRIFISIQLILNAADLKFISFSRYLPDSGNMNRVAGQVFSGFIIV